MTVLTTTVQFRCFWTDLNIFFFDLVIWWGFQIWYCTFPKWLSGPQKSNFLVKGPIWIFSSLTWKFYGDSKSDIVLSLNDSLDHKSQISLILDWFEYFSSSLTWKFDGDSKADIVFYLTCPTGGLQKSNFLFMGRFEYFFSLTCKFDGVSRSDIVLYLKWLTGPQISNFLFMDWFEYFILEIRWGFLIQYWSLPQMTLLTTKVCNNDSL